MTVRIVTNDTDFTWDRLGSTAHLSRGTFIDVPPGSALETAIGAGNLASPADPPSAAVHAAVAN